jgi:hypothetical protein
MSGVYSSPPMIADLAVNINSSLTLTHSIVPSQPQSTDLEDIPFTQRAAAILDDEEQFNRSINISFR